MRHRFLRAARTCAVLAVTLTYSLGLLATRAFADDAKPMDLNGIHETIMPNGLTVLTKEVHTAPVAHFAVYYHVGSVNEEVGQSGMSHLMEHMMFKGTKTRGPGVISATLKKIGAHNNASTWFDRTEYHETVAADRLEVAMQIESDRMVNSVYDEAEHQKEMTVVRSEYEMGENDPAHALSKAVRLSAYQVHPYRWQTIGFRADIENFTRDEMYAYYKNYYTPNNATVVIVGDFDTPAALKMVDKYFGALKPHPIQEHFITPEPPQEGERRVVLRRAGANPLFEVDYHIPGFGHPDRYVFDVLETILTSGRTSRFFQNLIQTGLAADAEAYDESLHYPDLMTITAEAQPGHTNAELEKAVFAEIEALKTTPITDEELARVIRRSESGYILKNDSVIAQADELGENAMRGDWRYGETYLENIRKVTAADVQRVAKKYLVATNRTVGYFEPVKPGDTEGQSVTIDGHRVDVPTPKAPAEAMAHSMANGGASRATARLVDRKPIVVKLPKPHSLAVAHSGGTVALPTRFVLDNGITVVVQENHANPSVSVRGALLSAGGVFDPADKRGLADFTADQLSRGTKTRSLLDIARLLEGVGASAGVSGDSEYVSFHGAAVSKYFDMVIDVLSDELRHPAFPADELEKARSQSLAGITSEREDTGTLNEIAFHNALYPVGHPYHMPTLDEQEAMTKALTRDDLVAFHNSHYFPDHLILTIVGDIEPSAALATVKKYFGDWEKNGNLPDISIPKTPLPSAPGPAIVIPVADKAQTDVRFGYPGQIDRKSPDFYSNVVLNVILGGGLSSRLSDSVRDQMGLVYGIGSNTDASLGQGPFGVYFGANPANVDKATAEMMRQLDLMREKGVTPEEVADTVSYVTGSYSVTLSTNDAVAVQLLVAQVYGLGLDYIQKRNGYYSAVTVDSVNAAVKKYLHPEAAVLVITGSYTGKYARTAAEK